MERTIKQVIHVTANDNGMRGGSVGFPEGVRWEATAEGFLEVFNDKDEVLVEYAPGAWTCVGWAEGGRF